MTLSDKAIVSSINNEPILFRTEDVKEFIKRIKDEIFNMKALGCISRRNEVTIKTIINEKAGDKLI